MSKDELAAALSENDTAPYGPVRIRRAEELAELAGQTGDRPLLIRALLDLVDAYEFGGQCQQAVVPFARVLRMWDENPGDFNRWAAYTLHWQFKWISTSVIRHPGIALSSIERWRTELADRYRQAGYGMHAVYAQRHHLAAHLGDDGNAARWFDEWLAADRDQMSDCHACDRAGQGEWLAYLGRHEEALERWAPVLGGELGCREEPHRVLAKSLLPLVKLGRLADARDNHLRGYGMVRGNANLHRAVGEHIEFAALTGNEARGLELLAEHAGWLAPGAEDPATRYGFLEAVAVLLIRLRDLGHADTPVPTPHAGTPTTPVGTLLPTVLAEIEEITRRFDERNGTSAVGDRSRARLAQTPLVDALALGVRATALAGTATPVSVRADSFEELVAAARRLDEARHPHSHAAWERVAAAGVDLAPALAARVAQSRGVSGVEPALARPLFLEAAERFAEAGEPGPAAANRARAGLAAVITGDPETGWAELDEASSGGAEGRDLATVRLCRARAAFYRWLSTVDRTTDSPEYAALGDEIRDSATVLDRLGLGHPAAALDVVRGQVALGTGDHDAARSALERAVAGYRDAGTPWEAAHPLIMLGQLALQHDDPAAAERYAQSALDGAPGALTPSVRAHLSRVLADASWYLGDRDPAVVDHALAAAHHFDEADPAGAAQLRMLAAQAFHRMRRYAEAAAIMETALPDLEKLADPYEVVRARRLTAQCLTEQGDPLAAARLLLSAATIAQDWPDQTAHATLAHDAAWALQAADRRDEADQAFERAGALWRQVGDLSPAIRADRARAWLLVNRDEPDWTAALAVFDAAAAELAAADPADPGLRWERPETSRQAAHLIMRWADDADPPTETIRRGLDLAEQAAAGFAALGDVRSGVRTRLLAAEYDVALDERDRARERVRALRAECTDPALVVECDRYLTWLGEG